ncbi:hypothetical protein [Arthrobacter cryoconiti]|uniref:Uncharacterized protein n=1 Tax=Arthrobacter cryoconiti TaxID=748907 RepID=A0ABV8QW92_9MICC|nr:hypothetical protein [Arthrobacter cryoconiti]MCC9068719.1 hypothetical protein [Arthrobacter cryoconiti]
MGGSGGINGSGGYDSGPPGADGLGGWSGSGGKGAGPEGSGASGPGSEGSGCRGGAGSDGTEKPGSGELGQGMVGLGLFGACPGIVGSSMFTTLTSLLLSDGLSGRDTRSPLTLVRVLV